MMKVRIAGIDFDLTDDGVRSAKYPEVAAQVEALVQAEIDDPRPDASSFSFAIYQALVEELGGDRVKLLQADDDPSEVSTDAAQ